MPPPAPPSTGQCHENDVARLVLVCAPSALSKMMGSLHPAGALYEKPVNIHRARAAHAALVAMLKRKKAVVRDVRAVLVDRVDWSVGDRIALENLAFSCLRYEFDEGGEGGTQGHAKLVGSAGEHPERFYVSDTYKRQVIEEMGQQQLVDVIFTNPTVTVSPSPQDTGFKASYRFDPLSNIVFVRDQQITTRKGIVMARLRSPQRRREVDIMEFCFHKLGLHVAGRIPAPGHLEGGDFFPAGEELCLVGIGLRSDWPAVQYLLEQDLLETKRVAVVRDEFEMRQERMHLDTVFNILSDDCCLMLADMMGEDSPTKRVVDEYVVDEADAANRTENGAAEGIGAGGTGGTSGKGATGEGCKRVGRYRLRRGGVEFSAYMRDQGYTIISVSGEEQLNYGCNVLNLGDGNIISIEKRTARRIACSPQFKGTVEYLDFAAVTSMYGGVHCACQVLVRGEGEGWHVGGDGDVALPATTFADDGTSRSSE